MVGGLAVFDWMIMFFLEVVALAPAIAMRYAVSIRTTVVVFLSAYGAGKRQLATTVNGPVPKPVLPIFGGDFKRRYLGKPAAGLQAAIVDYFQT